MSPCSFFSAGRQTRPTAMLQYRCGQQEPGLQGQPREPQISVCMGERETDRRWTQTYKKICYNIATLLVLSLVIIAIVVGLSLSQLSLWKLCQLLIVLLNSLIGWAGSCFFFHCKKARIKLNEKI